MSWNMSVCELNDECLLNAANLGVDLRKKIYDLRLHYRRVENILNEIFFKIYEVICGNFKGGTLKMVSNGI